MKLFDNDFVLNLEDNNSLSGKFLIASPNCLFSDLFDKSLIYLASHGKQGSIGLVVNNIAEQVSCKSLLQILRQDKEVRDSMITVHLGGPVEPERGFVLHSTDYDRNLLFRLNKFLAVSSNPGIIKDIANGKGPRQSLFLVGYTGWDPGQLEREIENNLWLIDEASPNILFAEENETKWRLALQRLGSEASNFSSQSGRG